MSRSHHRDVLACVIVTLGAALWGGVIVASWFSFSPIVLFVAAPMATLLGTWTAAMVLDDLDVSEAALSGGLAIVIGLGLRQLDARTTPELWMLGPCAIGTVMSALAAWLARRVVRPRAAWRPLAAGFVTCGMAAASVVLVVTIQPDSDWRFATPALAMVLSGGFAYLLIPELTAAHIIAGHALLVMIGWFGVAVTQNGAAAMGGILLGGIYGMIIGALSALLGFWGRMIVRRPSLDDAGVAEVAEARVVERD